ncbi:MAG: tetratricopeptide repeat protein [Myxococcota bacterium]|nr:tetratricopeptide repeat protein [Myxococcales bacterium]
MQETPPPHAVPDVQTVNELLDRGRLALEQGMHAEALSYLRAAHEQAPQNARIRSFYGLALARAEKRFSDAVELCNSALKQEFFNPALYFNAAQVYLEFDFKADAIRCLRRGLMIDPSNTAIATLLGDLGRRGGPVLRFLPRSHVLNVWLGHARHRVRLLRVAA